MNISKLKTYLKASNYVAILLIFYVNSYNAAASNVRKNDFFNDNFVTDFSCSKKDLECWKFIYSK